MPMSPRERMRRGAGSLCRALVAGGLSATVSCSSSAMTAPAAVSQEVPEDAPQAEKSATPIAAVSPPQAVLSPAPGVTTVEMIGPGPSPGRATIFSVRMEGGALGFGDVQASLGGKQAALWASDVERRSITLLAPVSIEETRPQLSLRVMGVLDDGSPFELERTFPVLPVEYASSKLRVGRQFLRPSARQRRRAKREQAEVHEVLRRRSPAFPMKGPFLRPTETKETSPFGTRRVLNGKQKSRHLGWDLDGAVGDPVRATQGGQVVLAAEHFYSGGTVILDHGQGLFSLYFHLSAFDVKLGDRIPRGERIGRVGKSGRVTGPHLHFAVKIDDVYVDPRALLDLPWSEIVSPSEESAEREASSVREDR